MPGGCQARCASPVTAEGGGEGRSRGSPGNYAGSMGLRVLIVQHGDKERTPGDPGLTELGRTRARTTARWLGRGDQPLAVWSSPMRRARQTAAPIAEEVAIEVTVEPRLRERMNWDDPKVESIEEFLEDWHAAAADRSYRPRSGDSSTEAAARFLEVLEDLATTYSTGAVIVVTHGGVTTDSLRTLLGDEQLRSRAPTLIDDGLPPCALTTLEQADEGWVVRSIATTDHL